MKIVDVFLRYRFSIAFTSLVALNDVLPSICIFSSQLVRFVVPPFSSFFCASGVFFPSWLLKAHASTLDSLLLLSLHPLTHPTTKSDKLMNACPSPSIDLVELESRTRRITLGHHQPRARMGRIQLDSWAYTIHARLFALNGITPLERYHSLVLHIL